MVQCKISAMTYNSAPITNGGRSIPLAGVPVSTVVKSTRVQVVSASDPPPGTGVRAMVVDDCFPGSYVIAESGGVLCINSAMLGDERGCKPWPVALAPSLALLVTIE